MSIEQMETVQTTPDETLGMHFKSKVRVGDKPIPIGHALPRKTMTKQELEEYKMRERAASPPPNPGQEPTQDANQRIDRIEETLTGLSTAVRNLVQSLSVGVVAPGQTVGRKEPSVAPPEAPTSPVEEPTSTTSPETQSPPAPPARTTMGLGTPHEQSSATGIETTVPPSPPSNYNPSGIPEGPPTMGTTEQSTIPNSTPSEPQEPSSPEPNNDEQWYEVSDGGIEPTDVPRDPQAEQVAILVKQTKEWMANKKPHKRFRGLVTQGVHPRLGYNSWSSTMQRDFDNQFYTVVDNEVLLERVCKLVLNMPAGKAVSPAGIASLHVAMAGFISLYGMATKL